MKSTLITFQPSGREGLVASETYIVDAARRLGVEIETTCLRRGECDSCVVRLEKGSELLSQPTDAEKRILGKNRISSGERLGCQVKIEREGTLILMTKESKDGKTPPKNEETIRAKDFKTEFDALPLEKKIARLLEMELTTIGETFSFVVQSPFKIFEKGMDVLAELGLRFDDEKKKSQRPVEHHDAPNGQTNSEKNREHKKNSNRAQ